MIITPNAQYNPVNQVEITGRTKLAPGITMAKFLGGYGDRVTLDYIASKEKRLQLAKQYYLHAEIMKSIANHTGEYENFRMVVAEGLYRPPNGVTLKKDSVNYFLSTGQAVVYELIDENGDNAVSKTFDFAVYLKDTIKYNKIILDYDSYDPNDELNAQIIIIQPEVRPPWIVDYKMEIETRFNNYVQSTNEFVEVLEI